MYALFGSVITWGCTALGAAAVFLEGKKRFSNALLEGMFGLSAGVMLAASFFSLLLPALEMSKNLAVPSWFPLLTGFAAGGIFIKVMDVVVPEDPSEGCFALCIKSNAKDSNTVNSGDPPVDIRKSVDLEDKEAWRRSKERYSQKYEDDPNSIDLQKSMDFATIDSEVLYISKKMFLLTLAVTIHNIPEGLVLGMAYGGLGHENGTKLHDALVLTAALGLQNIPEGLAVSIPIWRSGSRRLTSFCYGQLSGFVEVVSAVIGAFLVVTIKVILPYALSFAAGAMIYVVCKELIPASQASQQQHGILGVMLGFCLMMALDIAFE
uniref:Zinc transporter ZIP11 n=1 Tax=Arcella intermedia TaxID=1963864 RepID=A0A6B2L9X2_9EUKA